MLLIILIVVTVLFSCLLAYGVYQVEAEVIGLGLTGLLLTVLFGWILFGNIIPQSTQSDIVVCKVLHDLNAKHISLGSSVVATYTDVASFNYLAEKDEVKMVQTVNKNMYGSGITTNWTLSNER